MSQTLIDMTGQSVGQFQIIEYAESRGHGAFWWLLCLRCHTQRMARGTNIRKAQRRPEFQIECKGCGA